MTTISVTGTTPHRVEALAFIDEGLGPLAQLGMVSQIPIRTLWQLLMGALDELFQ
jgi:hypothetical protein